MDITIDPAQLSRCRLWILIPAAGDRIHATFAACLIKLLGTLRVHGVWYELRFLPGDSLVTRARNNLADIFLSQSSSPDTDFSLWLDCDILFNPDDVLQLLALDRDFLAAPYTRKGLHWDRIIAASQLGWTAAQISAVSGTPNVNWIANPVRIFEPMPVLEAGSGFWLVKRKVFQHLIDFGAAPRYRRTVDETAHYGRDFAHDFFRVGVWPETSEYLSEDWWFCREWRRLGGTLYCCFWMKTQHLGLYPFQMDMTAISALLSATGGYINGETQPGKQRSNGDARPGGEHSTITDANRNGDGAAGLSALLQSLAVPPHEAAVPRDPGPLGD